LFFQRKYFDKVFILAYLLFTSVRPDLTVTDFSGWTHVFLLLSLGYLEKLPFRPNSSM